MSTLHSSFKDPCSQFNQTPIAVEFLKGVSVILSAACLYLMAICVYWFLFVPSSTTSAIQSGTCHRLPAGLNCEPAAASPSLPSSHQQGITWFAAGCLAKSLIPCSPLHDLAGMVVLPGRLTGWVGGLGDWLLSKCF